MTTASSPERSVSSCQTSFAVAHPLHGRQRVALVAGAGKLDDADSLLELDLVVLDQRVREQLLAELVELAPGHRPPARPAAHADVVDALETERGERPLHGFALRIEDPSFGRISTLAFKPASGELSRTLSVICS